MTDVTYSRYLRTPQGVIYEVCERGQRLGFVLRIRVGAARRAHWFVADSDGVGAPLCFRTCWEAADFLRVLRDWAVAA